MMGIIDEKRSRIVKNGESNSKTTKEEGEEIVNVDFVARKFETMDCNGVEKLLEQLFLRCSINLSDIADLLIKQNHVGSVIKIDNPISDDEESDLDEDLLADKHLQQELEDSSHVYGIFSAVDLKSSLSCIQEVVNFIKQKATLNNLSSKINNIFNTSSVGMIISERFVNIPHLIALPCYKSLILEMEQAKDGFNFDYYFIPSKSYKLSEDDPNSVFVQQEDVHIKKNAVLEMSYCVKDKKDNAIVWEGEDDSCLIPYRSIYVLDKQGLNNYVKMLENEEQ